MSATGAAVSEEHHDDQAQDQIMAWHLTERGVAAQASMIMERCIAG